MDGNLLDPNEFFKLIVGHLRVTSGLARSAIAGRRGADGIKEESRCGQEIAPVATTTEAMTALKLSINILCVGVVAVARAKSYNTHSGKSGKISNKMFATLAKKYTGGRKSILAFWGRPAVAKYCVLRDSSRAGGGSAHRLS